MKKLVAYGIAFLLLVGFTGCQIPGSSEALEKITEAVEMMEEVEAQLDDIEAQLDELTDAFNTLADEYDKHLEKYHKAPPIKKTITKGPKKKITK
jgi:archaellum component FlaC